jgi:hypothetical protein
LSTKPPFDPTGTITEFFTICAFMSPRISVRKSSGRSDQRSPPRATLPPRRWIASKRVEYTHTSKSGRGSGSSGTWAEASLNETYGFLDPSVARTQRLVRRVARMRCR